VMWYEKSVSTATHPYASPWWSWPLMLRPVAYWQNFPDKGDVATMPFESGTFDLVVCQAAFKNFTQPGIALAEMHRVLRIGGTAVIDDMSSDATHADIEAEVMNMELGRVSTFMTKGTLEMLRRRAYSPAQFESLVARSPFQTCVISTDGIGLEVRLVKPAQV